MITTIFAILMMLFAGAAIVAWVLLRRMSADMTEMENFFSDAYIQVSQYNDKINTLFEQSVHYYDETIYEFIESSKQFRQDLEKIMENYKELQEEITAPPVPEPGPTEVLGVVKPVSGRGVEKL